MSKYNIIGIHATDRMKHAEQIQKVLTKYGHHISTRLGIHDRCDESPNGVILIEVDSASFKDLKAELSKITGLEVKTMKF
jgi:hypothetical protein